MNLEQIKILREHDRFIFCLGMDAIVNKKMTWEEGLEYFVKNFEERADKETRKE